MRSVQDIVAFVEGQQLIMSLLQAVRALDIDDCWIGAGLIRNAVWDHLHGLPIGLVAGTDVDVIYCDYTNPSLDRDLAVEQQLASCVPCIPWSVHNQARMGERNGDAPYLNSEDAIRCWPEMATAIAARLSGPELQIIAPHGVDDLVAMIVRPSPAFTRKMAIYESRIASKAWARRWPRVEVCSGVTTGPGTLPPVSVRRVWAYDSLSWHACVGWIAGICGEGGCRKPRAPFPTGVARNRGKSPGQPAPAASRPA